MPSKQDCEVSHFLTHDTDVCAGETAWGYFEKHVLCTHGTVQPSDTHFIWTWRKRYPDWKWPAITESTLKVREQADFRVQRGAFRKSTVLLKTASAHWKRIKSTKWARCRPDKCVLNVDTASWSDYRSHIKTLPSCCCYALRYTGRNIYWKWQWMKADNINHWV